MLADLTAALEHPQRHPDLHRSEANSGRFVHRLEHVGDQRAQFVIERGNGGGDLLEPQIGNFEDFA